MTDILDFLWTAFRQYWGVWVTGTGTVGLLFFGLGVFERKRGRAVTWKTYLAVLFCVFWFLGTFSAWHDSQKNLHVVIDQRAQDNSNLGACRADLQTQRALIGSWQERFADQQKTINALQSPQLQQQATINSCVVSLGKMNPKVRESIVVIPISLFVSDPKTGRLVGQFYPHKVYSTELIITTNEVEPRFHGTLRCDNPFTPVNAPQLPRSTQTVMTTTAPPSRISDREYEISTSASGVEWGPSYPAHMRITTEAEDPGNCTFAPL
jgi:hypothetical protein